MGMLDYFKKKPVVDSRSRLISDIQSALDSADLKEFILNGGFKGSKESALDNTALLRCFSLISESIGMLPLNLMARGDKKEMATEHPLYRVLKIKPNGWQTPYKFKSTMQANLLMHGNAYARVIRSTGRIIALIPLDSKKVTPVLSASWQMSYEYVKDGGEKTILQQQDIFHLSDLSLDGVNGISRVEKLKKSLELSSQSQTAALRMFLTGVMSTGALVMPSTLTDAQVERIRNSMQKYSGSEAAGTWMVLEQGIEPKTWAANSVDSQHLEFTNHQIEEVARAMGVPRPLLMMDDTSWGSGIEQLGIFFVQYGLQHWFSIWEQSIDTFLLDEKEQGLYFAKFNEKALLRGTLKDQADFFAKALGSGGHQPWTTANEVRENLDMPMSPDESADKLIRQGDVATGVTNEP